MKSVQYTEPLRSWRGALARESQKLKLKAESCVMMCRAGCGALVLMGTAGWRASQLSARCDTRAIMRAAMLLGSGGRVELVVGREKAHRTCFAAFCGCVLRLSRAASTPCKQVRGNHCACRQAELVRSLVQKKELFSLPTGAVKTRRRALCIRSLHLTGGCCLPTRRG